MADAVKDSFIDLERHRLRLEENVKKLRNSLQHWRTWDAEYEGLKEEILGLNSQPTEKELAAVTEGFNGNLVNQKEIRDITGKKNGARRSSKQMADLLDKRIEYVTQNIKTLQKQLDSAEEKLASVEVIRQPDVRTEEGLPLTEIFEELDDDGNVLSSKTSRPGDVAPQMLEFLSKIENPEKSADTSIGASQKDLKQKAPAKAITPSQQKANSAQNPSMSDEDGKPAIHKAPKKAVSFAKGTKSAVLPSSQNQNGLNSSKRLAQSRLQPRISRVPNNDEEDNSPPIIPANESPEDAALRKQMIDYNLSEVGSVVAELTLDEDSDFGSSDDEAFDDLSASSADEEDQWGRTTRRVVDDDYKKQMAELERRLNAKMMVNAGPDGERQDMVLKPEDIRTVAAMNEPIDEIEDETESKNGALETSKKPAMAKGVRWAERLDIASASKHNAIEGTITDDLTGGIRSEADDVSLAVAPKKQSRFKSSRLAAGPKTPQKDEAQGSLSAGESQTPLSSIIRERKPPNHSNLYPTKENRLTKMVVDDENPPQEAEGPPAKTISDDIVECSPVKNPVLPDDTDELDPELLQQEVRTEYRRLRNKMIYKQGGFLQEDSENVPIPEEEGGPPKISRFKAAKLKP